MCLEVLHILSEHDVFNVAVFQQYFVLGHFSCPIFPARCSCKSLLVVLTDFPSQNKMLLLYRDCISMQGDKLQNCHHSFFPSMYLADPCATYLMR